MKNEDIVRQSNAAYGQWAEQWRAHAQIHSKFEMKNLTDFENSGIGKAVLCVANGYSFEENIETIKKNQDNVDILCCDKTLGHLLENGIRPKFCMICDANVDYERYMEKWKDQLQDTIALVNVCANPKWTQNGNWKDLYFFVNRDVIDSHLEFSRISGCKNFIPAGTNVSNAMVIMLTQSDDTARRNFFGYDKILLIGFDYSWKHGGKYYAFNQDGDLKSNYMRHNYPILGGGVFGYTSGNLMFSAMWLEKYVHAFKLPIIQCSLNSLITTFRFGNLEAQMQYKYKPEDAGKVLDLMNKLRKVLDEKREIENILRGIDRDHMQAVSASI